MKKEISFIVDIWERNLAKVNERNTYDKLAEFCLKFFYEEHPEVTLKSLILDINKNLKLLKPNISSCDDFIKAFNSIYHENKYPNDSVKRKYCFNNQKNNGLEITFERNIEILDNKIILQNPHQKDIDELIVKEYLKKGNHSKTFFGYIEYNKPEFIFYQISLYNFSCLRIKKWSNILKKTAKDTNNVKIEDLDFFADLDFFFKKYNKLSSENERLNIWYNKLKVDDRYNFFLDYFPKNKLQDFNENLITLFRDDYYQKLVEKFNLDSKKSINKVEFLKTSIKEFKYTINRKSDGTRSYRGVSSHNDVYSDLVKGKREDYYYNLKMLRLAGETEAIQIFIEYLESLNSKTFKKIKTQEFPNESKKEILPIEIFENTRGYLKKNAIQVNTCYLHMAYDSCSILLRKITEILIIELYENEEIEYKIRDNDGYYLMLKGLINSFVNEKKFNKVLSRNMNEILPKIKRNGDLSAHNRKYNSTKHDIDKISDDFRILFQELINTIYH